MICCIIKSDPGKNPIFIFLDSSETDTLNLDDLTLSKVVEEVEKEYCDFVGKEPTKPFFLKYYKHCIYDTRMLIHELENILIYNKEQFHTFACRRIIQNVLKSFESNLSFIIDAEGKFIKNYMDLENTEGAATLDNTPSNEFRKRLYALEQSEYKELMKEFFYPISDAVGDYSNVFSIEKETPEAFTLIENLQFWMFEYHPTHIYKCINQPMKHYGSTSCDQKDIENLNKWIEAIEHILKICYFDPFIELPPFDDYCTKDFDYMLDEIQPDKDIQKFIRLRVVIDDLKQLISTFQEQKEIMKEYFETSDEPRLTAFDIVDTIKL